MTLSGSQKKLLFAIADGDFLKAHRDVEGRKIYKLHPLTGEAVTIAPGDVEALGDHKLIDSNKKFPAATFWLTEKGKETVEELKHGMRMNTDKHGSTKR